MADQAYIIDEYELVNCIATGTHSQVWEVAEQKSGAHYAMKLMLPEAFADAEQKNVLKHEGRIGKMLVHPNFLVFHKIVMTKTQGYLIMDYFRAPNLKAQIGSDPISVQMRLRKAIEGVCLALGFMHEKGWLHRDIKPDNILLSKSSEVRLIDFSLSSKNSSGFAKMLGMKQKIIQGTRTYIAPETIAKLPPTPQTDMYSLGITIFEALTGVPPFKGSSPNDLLKQHIAVKPPEPSLLNKNVAPEMDKFVLRLLAKKPAQRPKDMNEVAAEFRSVKMYKQDVQQIADELAVAAKKKEMESLNQASKLDSRADATKTELRKSGVQIEERPKPVKKPVQLPPEKKKSAEKPAQQQPAAQRPPMPIQPQPYPQPGFGYPQPYPMMPGGMPGYAPQYPYPQGAPQPQMGFPPGQYPPMPYPTAPPQPMPQQQAPRPQQPAPGQPQPPQRPVQQPPAAAPRPAPQPPAAPPKPKPAPKPADDLPMMDDLPPVL